MCCALVRRTSIGPADHCSGGKVSRSRVLIAVDVLTGLLATAGVVFFTYTMCAHVDLASVRTGPLVFYSALALLVAALLVLIQMPLVIFALVRRPGIRVRVVMMCLVGILVFAACFMLGEYWVERQLPPRQPFLEGQFRSAAQYT